MKCHGQGPQVLHSAVCLLTSLAALHVGMMSMGWNMMSMGFLANFTRPIEMIFGIAGAIGLVLWVMHTFFCDCGSRSM